MVVSERCKAECIKGLSDNLLILRVKANLSQEELAGIIGISRQSYGNIELKKKQMSWRICFSLLMFFFNNPSTQQLLLTLECFPEALSNLFSQNDNLVDNT